MDAGLTVKKQQCTAVDERPTDQSPFNSLLQYLLNGRHSKNEPLKHSLRTEYVRPTALRPAGQSGADKLPLRRFAATKLAR
jgi:hypothetical protein